MLSDIFPSGEYDTNIFLSAYSMNIVQYNDVDPTHLNDSNIVQDA